MMIFLGGFRIKILSYLSVLGLLFFLEGLHRTRALLVFVMAGMLGVVTIIPLASHLPFTFQRSLAFLPLDLSAEARQSAEDSSQWRINMWKALLPQVPQHLLLGKGYAITMEDYKFMGRDTAFHAVDESQQGLALAGDYHNGPLSVVIPFGIWGVIAFLWFVIAGMRVMYCNFRYGDESLRTINTYFWATYLYIFLRFLFVYGTMTDDMIVLCQHDWIQHCAERRSMPACAATGSSTTADGSSGKNPAASPPGFSAIKEPGPEWHSQRRL